MIDREARDKHAAVLRRLVQGQISNENYEDTLYGEDMIGSSDEALHEVFANGGWLLYCDMRDYKLSGDDALDRDIKKIVARWILFLRSDLPYLWVSTTGSHWFKRTANQLTLGLVFRKQIKEWKRNDASGSKAYWPFFDAQQYQEGLASPRFLNRSES